MRVMDKIISCELSYIPVQTPDYKADVKEVISIITDSNLDFEVSLFSTTVTGEQDKIFELVKNIFIQMEGKSDFTMVVKYSNICGCKR